MSDAPWWGSRRPEDRGPRSGLVECSDGRSEDCTYGATSQLVGLSVVRLVVRGLSVAHHGHNVGEGGSGAVVLVGVEEDTQALEVIRRAEDRTLGGALFGEPHGKPIAVQVAVAVDFELDLDLESGKHGTRTLMIHGVN